MRLSSIFSFWATTFALLFAATGASAASCGASTTSSGTLPAQSPNAVYGDVVPYAGIPGGFGCPAGSPVLTVLSSNYIRATISATTYKLTHTNGTSTVDFLLAATSSGAPRR